jgi:hypothetical protein
VPNWIKEKLKTMTSKNWKIIKTEILDAEPELFTRRVYFGNNASSSEPTDENFDQ